MSLSAGDKLGPYEILASIGAGGMGEVYRARDPRLGRDVAIKVSAERFSERFEREARAIASLNHPNICTLHDIGPNYLVMELVEGEAPQGPLPFDTAMNYARQIAAALEEAHEKGITHRDLKPANIKIKPDGTVKVLDFGLAKVAPASAGDAENSPTLSMAATQAGMILGTAGYMSPEQARGRPVDKRADIWAFGVVLYELLTGKRLFQGEDVTETLAAVVMKEPELSAAPPAVRRMLQKCLEKDPKKRPRVSALRLPLYLRSSTSGSRPARPILSRAWNSHCPSKPLTKWSFRRTAVSSHLPLLRPAASRPFGFVRWAPRQRRIRCKEPRGIMRCGSSLPTAGLLHSPRTAS
jgi:eukaryotic-like serine/threonine-protein kinase